MDARAGVAVGFFDGVHLGHQAILSEAAVALTFRAHPLSVVCPARAPKLIMSAEERLAAIRACGVADVIALDFTPALAAESPEAFLARLRRLPAFAETPRIRCGDNWRFGKGGAGDAAWLRARGVEVTVVPYAVWNGEPVSSSRIRAALAAGDVASANAMLGHAYTLCGPVACGKGLGSRLGFPTVNVRPGRAEDALLPRGVYEVSVGTARGIANYGLAPTLGDAAWERPVLEIHFLKGLPPPGLAELTVALHAFIRPERAFSSLADLQRQIAADCGKICL